MGSLDLSVKGEISVFITYSSTDVPDLLWKLFHKLLSSFFVYLSSSLWLCMTFCKSSRKGTSTKLSFAGLYLWQICECLSSQRGWNSSLIVRTLRTWLGGLETVGFRISDRLDSDSCRKYTLFFVQHHSAGIVRHRLLSPRSICESNNWLLNSKTICFHIYMFKDRFARWQAT